MDVFNALWDHGDQKKRPPDDNFVPFTMEEWLSMSATHKNLSGSLRCPLPPELEPPERPNLPGKNLQKKLSQERATVGATPNTSGFHGTAFRMPAQNKIKPYVPGLLKFPEFDRVSSLTRDEHRDCLNLFLKFNGRAVEDLTPIEKTEYQLFQCLISRVKDEQKDFLEHAKYDWFSFVDRTCKLKGDPHNYFLQHWQNRVNRIMAQYPKHYKKLRTFSLSRESKMVMRLNLIKNALNIGKIPVVKLPTFEKPYRIATSAIFLKKWGHLNIPPSCLNGTLHNVPVSRDPNAERLARLHGASFVISSGGLKCLLDNYDEKQHPPPSGLGKFWILPVIIREHRSFCDGKPVTKTIVFIDKPLPPPKVNSYDKVLWYHKHALMASTVHRHHPESIKFPIQGKNFMVRNVEEGSLSGNFMSGEESLACNSLQANTSPAQSTAKGSVAHPDKESTVELLVDDNISPTTVNSPARSTASEFGNCNSDDEDQLMIDLPEEDVLVSPSKPTQETPKSIPPEPGCGHKQAILELKNKNEPKAVPAEFISGKEATKTDERHQNDSADDMSTEGTVSGMPMASTIARQCTSTARSLHRKWEHVPPAPPVKIEDGNALPLDDTNVTYNLWSLQPEEPKTSIGQKSLADNFTLLIRSHIDGCEMVGPENYEALSLACKPEYQLEYAGGMISLSDITKQWAKVSIQPDSRIARVRVHNTDMVKIEKLSKTELECEARTLYQEDLNDTLITFHKVLSDLKNLACGEYLLQHTPDMGLNAELLVQSNCGDDADYILSSEYGPLPQLIGCDVPWQPLDPSVILPRHLYFQCMPCTFSSSWGPKAVLKPRKPTKAPAPPIKKQTKSKKKGNKEKMKKEASAEVM